MPYRVVQEHGLGAAIVPVEGEVHHFLAGTLPVAVVIAGHDLVRVPVVRAAPAPHGVHEHGDIVQVMAGGIHGSPMPLHVSVLDGAWRVIEPVVVAVTGAGGNAAVLRDVSVPIGGIVAAEGRVGILFVFRHLDELISACRTIASHVGCRAEQNVLFAPEFFQRSHPLATPPPAHVLHVDPFAEVAFIFVGVILPHKPPLLQVADANRLHTLLLGRGQGGQQQRREDRDNGDDNEQLYECECTPVSRVHNLSMVDANKSG